MPFLYDHAKKIVEENKAYAGLFLGTGSTKTRIALMLACGKTLVICPKTQKEDRNWEREVQKIKKEKPHFTIDLTVMSRDEFRIRSQSGWTEYFDTIIVDEAHTCLGVTPNVRYVNRQPIPKTSQIFEELGMFIMNTKPKRMYLLTATIMKSPMTVWGAAKLLGQTWDWYEFRDAFYVKLPMPGREVWSPRKDNFTKNRLAEAVKKLGYTGRLQDYFDVPEQTYKTFHVELTEEQKQRIKRAKTEFPDPLVLIGKRHQIENGVLAGDQFNKAESFKNAKIDAIIDLSIEFPRLVVFVKYTAQIAQIASALKDEGKKVLTLEGSTKDRGTVIKEANETEECIVIAQTQISAGWELPQYPVMVFASMSYSMVDRVQGEGRILRANALKKNLYIDLVVKGGVDEAVHKAIRSKKDFDERIYLEENE